MRSTRSANTHPSELRAAEAAPAPNWFAVYTKPRQEQVALANLERQAFECLLPMAHRAPAKARSRRPRRPEPLFPRYLFLSAAPGLQSLASVRSTRGVVGLVRSGVELIEVPAAIIAGIKARMQTNGGLITLGADLFRDGDKVEVHGGPFAAMEGIFKEYRGLSRSLLLLDILGRETAVELDARLLRRAG